MPPAAAARSSSTSAGSSAPAARERAALYGIAGELRSAKNSPRPALPLAAAAGPGAWPRATRRLPLALFERPWRGYPESRVQLSSLMGLWA